MSNSMNVGKNIKKYRQQMGLSVPMLSNVTDIDTSILYRYEHNKVTPKRNNLNKIAKALNISVTQLTELETGKQNCLSDVEIADLVIEFCKQNNLSIIKNKEL